MEYQDFELELNTQANGAHRVSVITSPAGEARQPITLGLDDVALRAQLAQIEQTLRYRANVTAEQQRANLAAVKAFGGGLFDALLNDNLKSLYDQSHLITRQRSQGLRLKLRVQSPLLATLPWELLYDARFDAFLCTSRQLSIVRYVALPRPVQLLATRPPLNVLGVVSAPKNLPPLAVDREKQQLEEALRPLLANGLATLTWLAQPNWRALLRAMRQGPWHVLHYVGHSGFDKATDDGYLSLEDKDGKEERLTAGQLGTLLADHGALRLVVLNSCQGARIGQDIYASTATTLVQRGIPAVIGMQYDISDNAALEFALTFYETLAENVPIETALAEARKAISLGVDESAEWGTAVFYTHAPQSILFDMQTTPPVVDTQPLAHLAESTARSYAGVEQIDQLVSTVRHLTPKLQKLPDPAAYQALGAAFKEVTDTWQVTEQAFEQVWQLYDVVGDLGRLSKQLLGITNYKLQGKVDKGRGHCHKIVDIYQSEIRHWVYANGELSAAEKEAIDQVFLVLGRADDDVFYAMVRVAAQIEATADQLLGLVEDDRADEARTVAKELRRTLSPLRTAVNRSLVVVEQLQAEFAGLEQAGQAANLQGDNPMDQPTMSRIALYDLIEARHNDSELRQLCFRMGVNYEDLGGTGRADKIRELVMYCERHVLTAQLQQQALAQQPPRPAGDTAAVEAWVAALQGCATIVSHERRNDVVRDLPLYIQGNIERRAALYDDVYNIARTCLQYADGMQALVAAIRKREGPTAGVQQLEALL